MATQTTKRSSKKDHNGTAEDRTAEICRTAAQIICEKGFDATSMNDIAVAVNLTKAGLYYYTTGKQDLLYRIINYAMSLVEKNVIERCSDIQNPKERLDQIIRNHVVLVAEGGGPIAILSDEVNCLPKAQRREVIRRKRGYLEFVRQTLRDLESEGLLQDLDPDIASLNLFATVLGVARWYRQDGAMSSQEVADEIAKFLCDGLLRE